MASALLSRVPCPSQAGVGRGWRQYPGKVAAGASAHIVRIGRAGDMQTEFQAKFPVILLDVCFEVLMCAEPQTLTLAIELTPA